MLLFGSWPKIIYIERHIVALKLESGCLPAMKKVGNARACQSTMNKHVRSASASRAALPKVELKHVRYFPSSCAEEQNDRLAVTITISAGQHRGRASSAESKTPDADSGGRIVPAGLWPPRTDPLVFECHPVNAAIWEKRISPVETVLPRQSEIMGAWGHKNPISSGEHVHIQELAIIQQCDVRPASGSPRLSSTLATKVRRQTTIVEDSPELPDNGF